MRNDQSPLLYEGLKFTSIRFNDLDMAHPILLTESDRGSMVRSDPPVTVTIELDQQLSEKMKSQWSDDAHYEVH